MVADQQSSDGTLELLQATPGAEVVINESPVFDEAHRQKILLDRARQFEGRRILIGLDADEALSANCLESKEWKQIEDAEPGTILRFRWVNILPGFKEAWIPPTRIRRWFCGRRLRLHADGASIAPGFRTRPTRRSSTWMKLSCCTSSIVAWERMIRSTAGIRPGNIWKHQQKGPLEIFREYNDMYGSWDKSEIHPLRPEWLEGYDRAGIDFRSLQSEPVTWWDREIVEMLREHGPERFRRIAIWNEDWNAIAGRIGTNGADLSDPRSVWEKLIHRALKATQKHRGNWGVRGFEHILRRLGW